jgi:hypothetical protein
MARMCQDEEKLMKRKQEKKAKVARIKRMKILYGQWIKTKKSYRITSKISAGTK